jgi:hypothetical protein
MPAFTSSSHRKKNSSTGAAFGAFLLAKARQCWSFTFLSAGDG